VKTSTIQHCFGGRLNEKFSISIGNSKLECINLNQLLLVSPDWQPNEQVNSTKGLRPLIGQVENKEGDARD
jgi:hypothetical protein